MKSLSALLSVFIIFLSSQYLAAQNTKTKQDTIVTIETKSSGTHVGQIVFESLDSIRIKTENFGVIGIAKKDIVYHDLYSIETADGNEYLGEIQSENAEYIVINSQQLGIITLARTDIRKMQKVNAKQFKDGKFWFPNPQSTRYFWSPNGFGLKKGEGYYQNIWVLWNQFAYGVTDNISIGAGMIPLFLFGGPTPIFGTVKFSIPISEDKVNLAGGAIFGTVLGEEGTGVGILYGISTFGSPDNNVSLGLGYGYAGGNWASSPMINVNGMFRVSSRGYIITENYYIGADGGGALLLSVGGRSVLKKAAIDYGLILPFVDGSIEIAIPWLGLSIPFGNTN